MQKRSRDDGRSLHAFVDLIEVICPRCGGHARIRVQERRAPDASATFPARLTCHHCGFVRTQRLGRSISSYALRTDGTDPYFGVPLWLRTPTRHGVVFAYNRDHLAALEAFVGAHLRERSEDPRLRWHNKSMASRLPRWMKLAQNREALLAALARLRKRHDEIA